MHEVAQGLFELSAFTQYSYLLPHQMLQGASCLFDLARVWRPEIGGIPRTIDFWNGAMLIRNDRPTGPGSVDQPLQEGIASQAISSVNAGARHFPGSIQVTQRSSAT